MIMILWPLIITTQLVHGFTTSFISSLHNKVDSGKRLRHHHDSNDQKKHYTREHVCISASDVTSSIIEDNNNTQYLHNNDTQSIIQSKQCITENSIATINAVPNVKSIIRFSLAACGVWLCSPILSLIDTSAVGLLSGTSQQAALNPAVSVTEYTALLIAFMHTGTTNVVASAHEYDRNNNNNGDGDGDGDHSHSNVADAFKSSLQLSTYVGIIVGCIIFGFSDVLLRLIIGKNSNVNAVAFDPIVYSAALRYIRIRALGMPALAITGTAQAACLGMKDMRSPFIILLMAASINFLGDIILVGNRHSWIGGAAGAAWATVFSQYAALLLFISWLTTTKKVTVSTSTTDTSSTRGLLAGIMSKKRSLFKLPPTSITKTFLQYFIPVTTTSAGKVSAYVAMAHVISSTIGTTAMAAQQIILSFFFCLTPIADSLSLTGQSYIPAFMERTNQSTNNINYTKNANALCKLTFNMMKSSILFSIASLAVVLTMPYTSRFFTSDPAVLSQIRVITPYVAAWFSYHAFTTTAEGILLGRKDLGFLGKSYAIYTIVIPFWYLKIKADALAGKTVANLVSIWKVFILYGFSRFVIWNIRLFQLTMKTMRYNDNDNDYNKKEKRVLFE